MLRTLSATIVCLLIMMIAVPSQAKLGNPARTVPDNFVLMEQLFNSPEAVLKEIKLKHWGQISNKSETLPELETKYLVLVKRLGLAPEKKTIQIDRDGLISISQLELLSGCTIQIFMQSVPEQDNPGATNWGIAIKAADLEQARQYYNLLKLALRDLGCVEEPSLEICASMPGSMSEGKRGQYLQQLAASVQAEYVEGVTGDHLSSLSLYTQEGTGWVSVGGRKINLNLAMRSIPSLNQTNLYIGMPLLFSDY